MPIPPVICKGSISSRWAPPDDVATVAAERVSRKKDVPRLARAEALLRAKGPGWRCYLVEALEHGRLSAVDREAMAIVGVTVDDLYTLP